MALHGALTAPGDNGAPTAPGHNSALTAPGDNSALAGSGGSGALNAPAPGNDPESTRQGYLASVREMHCHTRYLDEYTGELVVGAKLLFNESTRMIYSFTVAAGESDLVTGRAAVVLA
jgi:hypothetical protein